MIKPSEYAQRRLAWALRADFGRPITAFLINAHFASCCCVGNTYRHVRRTPEGEFADGHLIRTSDIQQVTDWTDFWAIHTRSGSCYVIVTFDRKGGRASLAQLLKTVVKGYHFTPNGLH
ncbi:hypothetical protein RYA05_17620 [Pseudomonas syringae pv. actinidiae]|jgi:hypothetical protein|uniref:hypothetical protein n=1 Tax=Pseudomonas TaxID=286 RepID=UPI00025FEA49|nr:MULTISPECIES: hypothetical protein [Pseudomonas]EPN57458.1 hypothetical protein A235_31962 [Pseudomonas syringae pv. actinidiae ICMP 19079]EPN85582.1 hypothetical protein A234_06122 [Pseudomonas syringae pv. actinidiae ICMP 19101]AKT27916.1 hypothetical protein IYO_000070 [Pseudomonas syringae pv. actinidiae ICMP 18884]AOE54494.1 hypothetical protein NZ708_00070 [Pseudomonas syringae pv. actinidiae ICMP 18708]APP95359.1 hypothetical protein PsaNZ45_00070 [Pseudomonas syringae pv. actinidiae